MRRYQEGPRPGNVGGQISGLAGRVSAWISEKLLRRFREASPVEKRACLLTVVSGALALGLMTVSSVYCFVTAFGLPMQRPAGTALLIFFSAVLLALPCYLPLKGGRAYLIDLIAVAAAVLLRAKKTAYSFCTALAVVTGAFGRVMGTEPVLLPWSEKGVMCDDIIFILGLLIAFAWLPVSVNGRMSGLDIIVLTLTLAPCLVLQEHVPARWAVVLLAISASCLLLTRIEKQGSPEAGGRVTAKLILPIILLCIVPALFRPPQDYRPSPAFEESVEEIWQKLEELFDPAGESSFSHKVSDFTGISFSPNEKTDEVDLSKTGSRRLQNKTVMYLYTNHAGTIYLKGASMERYRDNAWHSLDMSDEAKKQILYDEEDGIDYFDINDKQVSESALYMAPRPSQLLKSDKYTVFINTVEPINVLYYPYYADIDILKLCGQDAYQLETFIANTDNTLKYNCGYMTSDETPDTDVFSSYDEQSVKEALASALEADYDGIIFTLNGGGSITVSTDESDLINWSFSDNNPYTQFVTLHYLDVPEDIREELTNIARDNGLLNLPEKEIPAAVAEYVRGIGRYDLNTPKVPNGEDFTLWFLKSSHRGYCVHFATAATLLLRCCGIPARYVTGYMTYAQADEWNEVTSDEAHAWVEYYKSGVGWIPLEVTASSDQAETSEVTMTTNTSVTTTTADPTSPSTAPSQVSQSDREEEVSVTVSSSDEGGTSESDQGPGPGREKKKPGPWLLLLILPAAVALIPARRYLEQRRRQSLYDMGGNNRALQLWTECEALLRALGEEPQKTALDVARKAAFSKHTVSESETDILREYRAALEKKRVGSASAPVRLIDRYIRLLY